MATIWRPDTCKCELQFENANDFEIGNIKVLKVCDIHNGKTNIADIVKEENRTKNYTFGMLNDEITTQGKVMINFRWEFDTKRQLVVDYETLTISPKSKALAEILLNRPLDGADIDSETKQRIITGFDATIDKPNSVEKSVIKARLNSNFKKVPVIFKE
jgi:hypothetical protein